ncbi:uncharacterized protein LOC141917660 [Strix aluco]|uniref:uncharacterized protein LOC141917660 n=1 Tax=Strix aluco TaxID=111821 RepID=UPI003DA3E454
MVDGTKYSGSTQISISTSQGKIVTDCGSSKLECWHDHILEQNVTVEYLWKRQGNGLKFKFRIQVQAEPTWLSFSLTETVEVSCIWKRPDENIIFRIKNGTRPIKPTTTTVKPTITTMVKPIAPPYPGYHIYETGPHIIRKTGQQIVLYNPKWSLKQIELHLQLDMSGVHQKCLPFIKATQEGWREWLKSRTMRSKRDVTGVLGTGLGVLNSIDSEVIMNKLASATGELVKLKQPLISSLLALGNHEWLTSKLLPDWEKNNIKDHLMIVEGLEMIPKDISWALSCIQAQMWMQIVISDILREGEEGILPTEIRKIIWDKAKPQERELQSWWKLVNFTYERQDDKIIAFVLTVVEAAQHSIYPVTSIGLNHGGMIISPVGHGRWAWKQGDKWQTVNTELCINMGQQGYVCEGNGIQAEDMCLDTHQKECHFEIQSSINNDTVMIYIGEGCICLRTLCTSVLIDGYFKVKIGNYSNHCVCNFTKIEGCDFTYTIPVLTSQVIKSDYTLIRKIDPVSIGMNLDRIKEMLQHKDLISILEDVKRTGKEMLVVVKHDTEQIHEILTQVQKTTDHHWWDTLLGWSPTATGILTIALHPIIALLIAVAILLILTIAIYVWNWRLTRRIQAIYEALHFTPIPKNNKALKTRFKL